MVDEIPRHDYEIVDAEGNNIGKVASGTQSPILKEGISWAMCKKLSKVGAKSTSK
ncbi:hypothetical protein MWN41_03525 [Ornithobacterium rhinotracheale]|uniref:glycine cleavage T C-terminal barrel domain-containing protein n=1 Tax=Ornithobacterium rhinotracheale TaxID=28251 RepID=UPI001FF64711|nr:glycine cleavage T C-terminal barrel domain-containing protein [Ornithobacterium rhinotracheale]MCK0202087.1 hypothetical protein [Ornithobacterium rhinotracheale]